MQPGDRAVQQYVHFLSQASSRVGEIQERMRSGDSPYGEPDGGQTSRRGFYNPGPNRGAGEEPPWAPPHSGAFPPPSGDRYGGLGSAQGPWGSAGTRIPPGGYDARASQGVVPSSDEDDDDDEGSKSEYEGNGDSDDGGGIDEGLPHSADISRVGAGVLGGCSL